MLSSSGKNGRGREIRKKVRTRFLSILKGKQEYETKKDKMCCMGFR